MLNNHDKPIGTSQIESLRKAGDVESFPGGKITYLAPLPFPTPMSPYGPHIGGLNDTYMDFGLGSPQVFSWQLILGGSFTGAFMVIVLFPLFTGFSWHYFWLRAGQSGSQ